MKRGIFLEGASKMWNTPEFYVALFTGISLLIYFTGAVVSSVLFIFRKIDKTRDAILLDVNTKHEENRKRVDAMNELLIRHDIILNPEFNGNFGGRHHVR